MSTSSLTRKTQEVLVFIEEGAHVVKSISCLEPSPAAPHRGARELDLDFYFFVAWWWLLWRLEVSKPHHPSAWPHELHGWSAMQIPDNFSHGGGLLEQKTDFKHTEDSEAFSLSWAGIL